MVGLRGLWDTIKKMKHSSPRPKFCPKCKGHRIYPITTLGILPETYRCRDCGYEGSFFLEIEPEEGL
ncbi:MAG: transposase [Candidatus Bathyarchaeota archaeon]|nr:transposase [Candidatus Bathyarchaeota archaeon]